MTTTTTTTTDTKLAAPVVTLTNGLRVTNFSSPHPFNFTDGSVLPACQPDRVADGSLDRTDEESPFPGLAGITAVVPKFKLTEQIREEIDRLHQESHLVQSVILVPLPVLLAARDEGLLEKWTKIATICVADRQTKAIHVDRFCR